MTIDLLIEEQTLNKQWTHEQSKSKIIWLPHLFKAKEPTQFRYRLKGMNMVTCYGNSMVPIESFRTSLTVPRHEYKPKFKA